MLTFLAVAVVALSVAVFALWARLEALAGSLAEARAVLMSLPEVEARLQAAEAKRERQRQELIEGDRVAAEQAMERERARIADYAKYGLTPPG